MVSTAVRSGRLRHRVQFYRPKPAAERQNDMGQIVDDGDPVLAEVPCAIEAFGGTSRLRGLQVEEEVTHLVETRFLHSLYTTPDMWLIHRVHPPGSGATRRLNVIRTVDPSGLRKKLLHLCKEIPLAHGK